MLKSIFRLWTDKHEKDYFSVDSADYIAPRRYTFTRDYHSADVAINRETGQFSLVSYSTTNENSFFLKFSYSITAETLDRLLDSAVPISPTQAHKKQAIMDHVYSILGE